MSKFPPPPTPADADLTHYRDMPLEVGRLRDSGIAAVSDAEIFRCAVLLWCTAWHQVPAGSLPDDDAELCRAVGLGRDLRTWKKLRAGVLRGWHRFADGRLYHQVIAEKVIGAWNSTRDHQWERECGRLRKANKARKDQGQPPLDIPPRPDVLVLRWPEEFHEKSGGIPPETSATSGGKSGASSGIPPAGAPEIALKGRREGKGISIGEAPTGLPPDGKVSSVAARESPAGAPTRDTADGMDQTLARMAEERRLKVVA